MSNITIDVKNDAMLGNLNQATLYTELIKKDRALVELNNILKELRWKPIEEYDKGNYDWVLIKYFDGDFECVPIVAEKRHGKWYSESEKEIQFDVKYFFDMQQLDCLEKLRKENML